MATGAVGDRTAHAQRVVAVEFKQDTELVANLHQRMEENLALDSTKWSESATRINVPVSKFAETNRHSDNKYRKLNSGNSVF